MDLSVVEICAGAGGQALGLHLAGFRHELAIEIDEAAAKSLRANFDRLRLEGHRTGDVLVGDVADENLWNPDEYKKKKIDLLAGGVPCPPFSKAGKQLGADDERDLFAWAVKTAGRIEPKAVMLENVRGLNDARFGGYRQAVIDEFDALGYRAEWQLLEARNFGIPQLRPRMVLVALQKDYADYFEWPEQKLTTETVSSVLSELMGKEGFPHLAEWQEKADSIAPTIVGGSKKHGGADLGPTRAKLAWQALWIDGHGIANEVPTKEWKRSEHPRGPKLTIEMVKKLQGWNGPEYEDWIIEGGKTSKYRQIGNAFPPPMARAVGEQIARALRKQGVASQIPADRKMHDEVYRLLRDNGEWMTPGRIQKLLGGRLTQEEIIKRIVLLGKDFSVEERVRGTYVSYKLGAWKAFQGQADHGRHLAYAERKTRGLIS
jgi:DNA (cytosine-5)-methyltransferase 1